MLIALVGTLAFASVWFVLVRPKPSADGAAIQPVPAAPTASSSGSTSLTERPAQAQAAADAASKQAEAVGGASAAGTGAAATPSVGSGSANTPAPTESAAPTGDATAAPAPAPGPTTAASDGGAERPVAFAKGMPAGERTVLRQLAAGKTVVMLFWTPKGDDDRAARRAVREAARGRTNVAVRLVPAKDVGVYESITGGVTITQTPTTMIIGPERKAVTITGLVDPLEIEQAIDRMAPAKG